MSSATLPRVEPDAGTTAFRILAAISFCHLLNDMMQSVVPAVYPILKTSYHLDFSQIGMITASLQITASLLQPLVGIYTDAHPKPYSLAIGMGFTLTGLLLLSSAPSFLSILGRGSLGRCRVCRFSPRIIANRPPGLRRAARSGAISVSGRRQRRLRHRTSASRLHSPSQRAAYDCMVLRSGPDRHSDFDASRDVV